MELSGPKNIRISDLAEEACKDLVKEGYFDDHIDAYRAAIFVAMAQDLDHSQPFQLKNNKWDSSAVFRDGVDSAVAFYFPEDRGVVELGMKLAEAGLKFLQERRLAQEDLWKYLIPTD